MMKKNLNRDWSNIIMHFSPAIFSCSFVDKRIDLTRVYVFPGSYNRIRETQVCYRYIPQNGFNGINYELCM